MGWGRHCTKLSSGFILHKSWQTSNNSSSWVRRRERAMCCCRRLSIFHHQFVFKKWKFLFKIVFRLSLLWFFVRVGCPLAWWWHAWHGWRTSWCPRRDRPSKPRWPPAKKLTKVYQTSKVILVGNGSYKSLNVYNVVIFVKQAMIIIPKSNWIKVLLYLLKDPLHAFKRQLSPLMAASILISIFSVFTH